MLIFKEAFSNILNYVNLNPELLSYLRTNINFISDYIYDISYDNPDLSIEEIIGIIRDDYDYFANCIYSNSGIRSTSLRYEACNYLLDNPQKISELLKIIENDNLSPEDTYSSANIEIYSTDFEETLLKFILYRKTELDTYLSDYSLNDIEYIQNYIDIIRKNLKRQPYIKRKN